ncbi:MAG: hypothetical protein NTV36_02505, partial [Candidatus Staskawiczbacteria bacterium]|nr:hypothetical protein [Candidatus Staskawiczbacteria bacterium]
MTRAALNAGLTTVGTTVTPGVTTTGVEGSITATASPSPSSGTDVYTGTSVAVSAVDVKATNSDIAINRMDLNFNVRPWLYISALSVSDGTTSKSVAVTQSNSTEITIGSNYSVRIDGVGIVVPKGVTKKLTFTVTGVSALPAGTTSQAVITTVSANSVRGTDGAGLSQTAPTSDLTATRTFTVKTADTGTLTVSASADTPKDRNVIIAESATTDVPLLKFDVQAKSNDVVLRNVNINVTTSTSTLATMMPTVHLLDGSTELASTSTAASSTFGGLSLLIPKGTTKTLTVVGTLAKTTGSATAEGDYVAVNLRSSADTVNGEDASTFSTVNATADITAYKAYAFLKAPTFAYVSSSVTPIASLATGSTTPQSANYELKFNLTAV